jgi:site-specific recombinase XerD
MKTFSLEKFPLSNNHLNVRKWLSIQVNLGLAKNTLEAYARALEDYIKFSFDSTFSIDTASREDISVYVNHLRQRSKKNSSSILMLVKVGLSNATLQQKLTAIRLYYDYLIEEGKRNHNPVGRGYYTKGKNFATKHERGLILHLNKLPWIPSDEDWIKILQAAKQESLRNKAMLAFAYDAALRREELCLLQTKDIDPSQRLIRVRAETTKNHLERIVPYSTATSELYLKYLRHRANFSQERGLLFLSESNRNKASPISMWTWTKVVEEIAARAGIVHLTTHTFRHLRLTDLARAGWEIYQIAIFAGHRNTSTTLQYIHLSGRDLSAKLETSMASIYSRNIQILEEIADE